MMIKLSDHLYIPPMGRVLEDAAREKAAQAKSHKRYYAAARRSRLNADWVTRTTSSNWETRQSTHALRARAREVCRNAPHPKKFLRMVRTNVIGPKGLQLMVRAYMQDGLTLDADLNKSVQTAWWEWGFAENCSVSGKLSWLQAQRLFVTQLARDGEVLVQKLNADNPFGFALKFWNVDYLDETYNDELPNGNRVIMSVEIDSNTDKPVAYWMTTPPSDVQFVKRRERLRVRVPAEQMIHAFLVIDDESQVRGVTWFHAVLIEGKNYEGYKLSVEDSAKMMAMSGGFFTKTGNDETEFKGEEDEDGQEMDMSIDFSPASFHVAPDGYDFKQFDPKQPTQNHESFCKTILTDIAAGLDVPYFDLTGDLSNVNYSSARVGQADERDVWRELQEFVADRFCREIYHSWLLSSMLSGAVKLDKRQYLQVQNPMWNPRGWGYVDPQKEIGADVEGLANNILTLTGVLAKHGVDPIDHFETIKQERELAKKYGIDLVYATKVTATEASDPKAGEGDSTGKPQPKRELTNGHALEHIDVEQ